jgi:hypothetical protein
MAQLLAAFADLAVLSEEAIHRADRAVIDPPSSSKVA